MTVRRFQAPGIDLALQQWGDGPVPVLALHGWLDNSAGFTPLAPHLQGVTLVAPDLAGHGHSAHRPATGSYNLWDDLRELLALADWLGWERFTLLGHSRGAMIALLLAASLPERIERVAFLDGLWPLPDSPDDAPQQLGRHLREFRRTPAASPRFATLDEAVAARRRHTPLPDAVLAPLVQRNLRRDGDAWVWSTDARLRYASAFKLSQAHNRAFAAAVRCPNRVLLAEGGMAGYGEMVEAIRALAHLQLEILPGGHHLHMENPALVASRLNPFWAGSALNCS